MTDETLDARLRVAYEELDRAVHDLMAIWREQRSGSDDEDNEYPETLTDWVLVTGAQFFDEDGDRAGVVSLLPRSGSQPSYITAGLLHQALSKYA